jgi:hypothetical protein
VIQYLVYSEPDAFVQVWSFLKLNWDQFVAVADRPSSAIASFENAASTLILNEMRDFFPLDGPFAAIVNATLIQIETNLWWTTIHRDDLEALLL